MYMNRNFIFNSSPTLANVFRIALEWHHRKTISCVLRAFRLSSEYLAPLSPSGAAVTPLQRKSAFQTLKFNVRFSAGFGFPADFSAGKDIVQQKKTNFINFKQSRTSFWYIFRYLRMECSAFYMVLQA